MIFPNPAVTKTIAVIYGGLSRYDKANGNVPFSGAAGAMFKHRTLDPLAAAGWHITIYPTTAAVPATFPTSTRILLLGTPALAAYGLEQNLNKLRGYCLCIGAAPAVATYHPIDCWDLSAEAEHEDDDGAADSLSEDKDVGSTARANYFAWALADVRKLVTQTTANGWQYLNIPTQPYLQRPVEDTTAWLTKLPAGTKLILDVECRPQDHTLDCIGLLAATPSTPQADQCHVVPIYGPDNRLCFGHRNQLSQLWRALCLTFLRPDITIVGHNLAFDLSLLHIYYGLPIPRNLYDTMIAMHRAEPNLEKSLSHAISYYLNAARNHKADICPNTSAQNFRQLLTYNAADLYRTAQLAAAQQARAASNPPLAEAIAQGNELLHVTLMMSATGLRTDAAVTARMKNYYTTKAQQLARCCAILTGRPNFNPGSPNQIADFIYNQLKYPVLTQTATGGPGTNAKSLYLLMTKQSNPLFPLLIAYKETKKAASNLDFKPYIPARAKG